ncbi:MAG: phosphohexomutase domain-containing protein [Ferrimicrobium sp.]
MAGIFKAYDIRGVVPDELDESWVRAIGTAFAETVGGSCVVVGRDMRISSPELVAAFMEGVCAASMDVVDIGLASTDMLYFASGRLELPGAMITASHNPGTHNGIKLCRAAAVPIGRESGLHSIETRAREIHDIGSGPSGSGTISHQDLLGAFVDHIRSFVDVGLLSHLRVVVDTANGMGGLVVPAVFEGLGMSVDFLYPELDGSFPNHPADPIQPENLVDLKARVLAYGADVGLAFDGDADRVFLVDDKAAPLSGSVTTAIIAKRLLEVSPGSSVLYNLICSKAVPEVVAELGGKAIRTRVGHSYIKAQMAETQAVFGGEHSGHYYFRDNYRADSGLIAALYVLEDIARQGRSLSEIRLPFERYAASGEVNTKVKGVESVIAFVERAYDGRGEVDHLDGLTLDFGDWWFNLRPSNTEPLLRLNLEARSADEVSKHSQEVFAVIAKAESLQVD